MICLACNFLCAVFSFGVETLLWFVETESIYTFVCLRDVLVVVLSHLLIVIVCGILGFENKPLLFPLCSVLSDLLIREVEVSSRGLVEADVSTDAIVPK